MVSTINLVIYNITNEVHLLTLKQILNEHFLKNHSQYKEDWRIDYFIQKQLLF